MLRVSIELRFCAVGLADLRLLGCRSMVSVAVNGGCAELGFLIVFLHSRRGAWLAYAGLRCPWMLGNTVSWGVSLDRSLFRDAVVEFPILLRCTDCYFCLERDSGTLQVAASPLGQTATCWLWNASGDSAFSNVDVPSLGHSALCWLVMQLISAHASRGFVSLRGVPAGRLLFGGL